MIPRMPKIDDATIHLNALFLQPTFKCALNCQGCYVKGMEHSIGEDQLEQGLNLDRDIYEYVDTFAILVNSFSGRSTHVENDQKYSLWANQITLAVDNRPSRDPRAARVMQDVFINFAYAAHETQKNPERPEFHITCNSPGALAEYVNGNLLQDSYWHSIDVVTFSFLQAKDIPILRELKLKLPKLHINWNLTVFNQGWLDAELHALKEVATVVDSIYYVLHKPALGDNLNTDSVKLYFNALPVIKRELGEAFSKVNIDGCVADARKYRDTGHGCSSNISRFQVWPNGSVSGCPYQQRPVTGGARSVHGILDNIRAAAKRYEFDDCRIPETLHPTSERGRARLGFRKPGSGRSLQIID